MGHEVTLKMDAMYARTHGSSAFETVTLCVKLYLYIQIWWKEIYRNYETLQ